MVVPVAPRRQAPWANLAPWQRRDAAHITQICAIRAELYRALPSLMRKHEPDIRARNRPAGAPGASSTRHREADPAPPPPRSGIVMTVRAALDPTSGATAPLTSAAAQAFAGAGPLPPAAGASTGSNGTAPGSLCIPPESWRTGVTGPRSSSRCGTHGDFGPGFLAPPTPQSAALNQRHRPASRAAFRRACGVSLRAANPKQRSRR